MKLDEDAWIRAKKIAKEKNKKLKEIEKKQKEYIGWNEKHRKEFHHVKKVDPPVTVHKEFLKRKVFSFVIIKYLIYSLFQLLRIKKRLK